MSWRLLSRDYAFYRGMKLEYLSSNQQGQVLLATDDPTFAAEAGFVCQSDGCHGWVSESEITEFVRESWWGELDGVKVLISAENDDEYSIISSRPLPGWNLQREDKHEWGGSIPKSAVTKVWRETHSWPPRPSQEVTEAGR